MHLGIKAKQIGGVTLIVGLAVVMLSLVHLSALVHVSLVESRARGDLLKYSIYQRATAVVPGSANPYQALHDDGGMRNILESSIYAKSTLYAAICDTHDVAVASSDPFLEKKPLAPARALDDLLNESAFSQLVTIFTSGGQTLEVRQPLLLNGERFGSIRVGVSTLLIRSELTDALKPAALTALVAFVLAIVVSASFARLILRPIHVLRSGLTRLGQGEFGVRLDLPQQDEFGELGTFFNAVSAQLSADRTQLVGQKANLESAVEHMEDEVAIFNPEGELLFANPAMRVHLPAEAFGRPVDDVLPEGHPYRTLVQTTIRERQSSGPVSTVAPGQSPAGDGPAVTAASPGADSSGNADAAASAVSDDDERLVMAHAIKDREQHLVGVMLVARDIQYLGRVQSMLNYSRKLVALGRLSAGVAHEVKNPLNAMTIHLELLKHKLTTASAALKRGGEAAAGANPADGPLGLRHGGEGGPGVAAVAQATPDLDPALEHVRIISGEIQRLDQVMQGFLKFTRSDELKLQAFSLGSLVEEVVRVVEPECSRGGVAIQTEGLESVPDINGDPGMLRQAFLNLALNACQAMPNGGTLRVAASVAPGHRVALSFEDTGVGIKPAHLEKIFDLYFTTRKGGSGIGLSMVYRIVQMHDGEIEVQSTEGRGTTFRLLLPQA